MYTKEKTENNNYMKQKNITKINSSKIFKLQFLFSIIISIFLGIYYMYQKGEEKKLEEISKILNKNLEFSQIYNGKENILDKNLFLGKIIIEKIEMEYPIFNDFTEELLKIAPCKFFGENIGESGNICIAGHNYNDKRFFSRLDELQLKDEIKLIDLYGKEYMYMIFDIFETEETNVNSVIRKNKSHELTLLTCNNSNKKRIVIKAFLKK